MDTTERPSPEQHLQNFITRYSISPPPGIFEGAFDDPSFAVDLTRKVNTGVQGSMG
jgi:hypothetical protein